MCVCAECKTKGSGNVQAKVESVQQEATHTQANISRKGDSATLL